MRLIHLPTPGHLLDRLEDLKYKCGGFLIKHRFSKYSDHKIYRSPSTKINKDHVLTKANLPTKFDLRRSNGRQAVERNPLFTANVIFFNFQKPPK